MQPWGQARRHAGGIQQVFGAEWFLQVKVKKSIPGRFRVFPEQTFSRCFVQGFDFFCLTVLTAGMKYFFVWKRWLDPKDSDDLKLLDAGWDVLRCSCPTPDLSELKAKFLLVCQHFHDAWEQVRAAQVAQQPSEIQQLHDSEHDSTQASDQDSPSPPSTSWSHVCVMSNFSRCHRGLQEHHTQHCGSGTEETISHFSCGELSLDCATLIQRCTETSSRSACEEEDENLIQCFETQAEWHPPDINFDLSTAESSGGLTRELAISLPAAQDLCNGACCEICAMSIMPT